MSIHFRCRIVVAWGFAAAILLANNAPLSAQAPTYDEAVANGKSTPGLVAIVGFDEASVPIGFAKQGRSTIYVQTQSAASAESMRVAADAEGLLGTRVFIERGDLKHLHLGDNLADVVFASAQANVDRDELLRITRPGGTILIGDGAKEVIVKPLPDGMDDWRHPYHGADNNPRSSDALIRAPYLTQFYAMPWFGPMPEVTVASGGRLFKAFGHIAMKRREWPLVNKLAAFNAYNGTELWQRDLAEGFMVHRNTIVATPDVLYLGDDKSCKLIDAATGETIDEIVPSDDVTDEKVWKWMALEDGVLYALLGPPEQPATVLRGERTLPGWPWNGLGEGYAQQEYPWGFGHTLLAIDAQTKQVLWSHREDDLLDSRATCMAGGKLFFASHGKFVGCLDIKKGEPLWKTSDSQTLALIGEHDKAQNPRLGFSSTSYVKCNEQALYFAGPQRHNLVALSADDGRLLWSFPHGNFQLILRDDGVYAMGRTETSKKFDLASGEVLADLQCYRGNCTRATATPDSIFTRGYRHSGTQRLILDGDRSTRIALMRPACQDGVVVSNGLLYWGPWMCDCNLSLTGMIALGSAGDFQFNQAADEAERLQSSNADWKPEKQFEITSADWPAYRGDNARSAGARAKVTNEVRELWQFATDANDDLVAPVAAGGFIYLASADGALRAVDAASGEHQWTVYTGGRIFYPPALAQGKAYVGSGDGWVYAIDAAMGKQLWRFRAAPAERTIPVYGRLMSTWPVASGVLVEDGVVYAAAGIASYDGTHVYALDAQTGQIRWQNNSSGRLVSEELVSGVSVQGHLLLHNDRLYMAGGNVVSPAVYDIADGRCLNQLKDEWIDDAVEVTERQPDMNKIKSPRGSELFLVGETVHVFDRLLYAPKEDQLGRYFNQRFVQAALDDVVVRGRPGQIVRLAPQKTSDGQLAGLWENRDFARADALAVVQNAVVVAGQLAKAEAGGGFVLAALDVETGVTRWTQELPAPAASWGMCIDRAGRIVVTLDDGRAICFGAE